MKRVVSFADTKVGTAHAGSPNSYENVRVIDEFGFRHLFQDDKVRLSKCGVISMQYGCFHNFQGRETGVGHIFGDEDVKPSVQPTGVMPD